MYKVGDGVWYATFQNQEIEVPCPVCYGNKSVIVVLGNGEEVSVECDYCGRGWQGPQGYVKEYQLLPRAEYMVITQRRVDEKLSGDVVEYRSECYMLYPDRMFDNEQEAIECAVQMAENDAQEKLNKPKFKNEKSYAWNAGYHLKMAKDRFKEAQYHEEKAKVCKSRSKD